MFGVSSLLGISDLWKLKDKMVLLVEKKYMNETISQTGKMHCNQSL